MTDTRFSNETKEATHDEQLPSTKNSVKCLSKSELKRVMNQILSGYSTCGDRVKND